MAVNGSYPGPVMLSYPAYPGQPQQAEQTSEEATEGPSDDLLMQAQAHRPYAYPLPFWTCRMGIWRYAVLLALELAAAALILSSAHVPFVHVTKKVIGICAVCKDVYLNQHFSTPFGIKQKQINSELQQAYKGILVISGAMASLSVICTVLACLNRRNREWFQQGMTQHPDRNPVQSGSRPIRGVGWYFNLFVRTLLFGAMSFIVHVSRWIVYNSAWLKKSVKLSGAEINAKNGAYLLVAGASLFIFVCIIRACKWPKRFIGWRRGQDLNYASRGNKEVEISDDDASEKV